MGHFFKASKLPIAALLYFFVLHYNIRSIIIYDDFSAGDSFLLISLMSLIWLLAAWIGVAIITFVFCLLYMVLFVCERLSLRIVESKRGPVLVVSAVLAIIGVALDIVPLDK
jgi:hypothetical protein